jgi:hypothetical protein
VGWKASGPARPICNANYQIRVEDYHADQEGGELGGRRQLGDRDSRSGQHGGHAGEEDALHKVSP